MAAIGPKRHGKNTVCESVIPWGFVLEAFADPVKEVCALVMQEDLKLYYDDATKELPCETYPEDTRRTIMQEVGTELFRSRWPDVWVRNFQRRILRRNHRFVAVPDLRFPNELAAVKEIGNALIIRVINLNLPVPDDTHESEIHYRTMEADYDIINDGTIEELQYQVRHIVRNHFTEANFECAHAY